MERDNAFHIGICMAGAISAGAYTAGVMDYLIEALEAWEKRRGEPGVPTHRVVIPVIGGSSAGGMTGIIAARALYDDFFPVTDLSGPEGENLFYRSWVELTSDDMFPVMLGTGDLAGGKVYSLLNSDFIGEVADRSLKPAGTRKRRDYIADRLKVFVTTTNLEGFTYNVAFHAASSAPNRYYISRHNDYVCFVLGDEGMEPGGWMNLEFLEGREQNVHTARESAMATGAFPIGLRARKVLRPADAVNANSWISTIKGQDPAKADPLETLNIDGGLINNEPFDLIREVLDSTCWPDPDKAGLDGRNQDYDRFRSTILMIDPFPAHLPEHSGKDDLLSVISSTFGAMMGQLRTKPDHLVAAMSSADAGQYLVAPSRTFPRLGDRTKRTIQGAGAIACGSLGGFGGFLSKEFRVHDFHLGRANCEWFLRHHFTVPKNTTNEIFQQGYRSVSNQTSFTSSSDGGLQIIPIFTKQRDSVPMPVFSSGGDWPVLNEADILRLSPYIRQRIKALLPMLLNKHRKLVKVAGWVYANRWLTGKATEAILKGLKEHNLVKQS